MSYFQGAAIVLALLALANHEDAKARLMFTVMALAVLGVMALKEVT